MNSLLLNDVINMLEDSKDFGLEAEVVLTALRLVRENPELTIEECIFAALDEWDL